jgi:signal transduction histidine kinase
VRPRRGLRSSARFLHVYRWRLLTKIVVGVTAIMLIVLVALWPTLLERRKLELEEYVSSVREVVWRSILQIVDSVEDSEKCAAAVRSFLGESVAAASRTGPFESSGFSLEGLRADVWVAEHFVVSTDPSASSALPLPAWVPAGPLPLGGLENPDPEQRGRLDERAFGAKTRAGDTLVVLSLPRDRIDGAAWSYSLRLVVAGVGIVACMDLAIILYLWAAVLMPLRRINAANEALASGKLSSSHIPVREIPLDEIGNIMATHNLMLTGLEDVLSRLRHAKQDAEHSRGMLHQNYLVLEEIKEDLEDKNRRLQDLDRMKSEFLANMTHELRTPLTSIIGFTDLTLRTPSATLPDPARQNLELVKESAGILLQMINDLLDLSKIESGKTTLFLEPVDVGAVAREAAAVVDPLARQKKLALVSRIDGDGEALCITTDRLKVRQIVLNLLGNAVKFTDEGSVELSVRRNAGVVEVAVRDTGIGMAPEDVPKIFEAFRQLDGSSTRRHGGTGLGLSIVKRLVALLEGDVAVETAPGQGSTFTVSLPARRDGAGA